MTTPAPSITQRINSAQTRLLYSNATVSTLISLVNATLVFFFLWDMLDKLFLLIWVLAIVLIAIIRIGIYKTYWVRHGYHQSPGRWFRLYMFGALGNGILWSIAIFHAASHDVLWLEGFIALITAGMATGGLVTMTPALSICIPYMALIMTPLAAALLGYGDPLRLSMGVLVILYLALLSRSAYHLNRAQMDSVRLRFESEDMFGFLRESKAETEQLRESLAADMATQGNHRSDREQLFDYTPDPLCVIGRDGYMDLANPALQSLTGMSGPELASHPFIDLLHPDDTQIFKAAFNKISEGETGIHFTCRIRSADGEYISLSWHTTAQNGRLYANARRPESRPPVITNDAS